VTWLPVPETKKCARPGNRALDFLSQASRTRVTWGVTGSRRLRFPLDQTMSMSARCRSTCAVFRARVSPVRSPHECIKVKNAGACHRHGDQVSSVAAAVKNTSISWRLSR
jgi:hypothetical protein